MGAKARTKIEADKRAALKHFMEKYCATAGIKFEKVCKLIPKIICSQIYHLSLFFVTYSIDSF